MTLRRAVVRTILTALATGWLVLLTPGAAFAATQQVQLTVTSDGAGLFNGDGPGLDSGPNNGVVRSWDVIAYLVEVNSNDGDAVNQTFTMTAPPDTAWSQLPTACTGAGSGISGAVLTCNVGTTVSGTTRTVPVQLQVRDAVNNTALPMSVSVTADTAPPASAGPLSTTVSAAPRFDLIKSEFNVSFTRADGPDGTLGAVATFR